MKKKKAERSRLRIKGKMQERQDPTKAARMLSLLNTKEKEAGVWDFNGKGKQLTGI